ncbi:hypothetical protein M0802_009622 [Mischocyttarus mexicanus]|nr:hypothetical protein M0802_009622 [Mischocyttarus mexicanus]
MYMLFENTSVKKNGVTHIKDSFNKKKSEGTWIKRLSTEWVFSLIVFLLLSLIVIEKIYFSYVPSMVTRNADGVYNKASINISSQLYDFLKLSNIVDLIEYLTQQLMITGEEFKNTVFYYYNGLKDALNKLDRNYLILIMAILGGVLTTIFNWSIIYMDSRIPGYDPPFPFHLFRKGNYRIQITAPINLNYFIGALIGLSVSIFILFEYGYFDS